MANPITPVASILEAAQLDPTSTEYTQFENDQVLTAGQLNKIYNYLNVQNRLTRTKMVGVGIVCGLKITHHTTDPGSYPYSIHISPGTAITTDGDLIHFEDEQVFNTYNPVAFTDSNAHYGVDSGHPNGFFGSPSQPIRELTYNSGTALASADMNKAVVLYIESYYEDMGPCTSEDCDNKGLHLRENLKVLLISTADMGLLHSGNHFPKVNADFFSYTAFKPIFANRVMLDVNNTSLNEAYVRTRFLTEIGNINTYFQAFLTNATANTYTACLNLLEELYGADPTPGWKTKLDAYAAYLTSNPTYPDYQYLYDFFKDITDAYNEFRESLFGDNSLCCPSFFLFPKHIMLGLVVNPPADTPLLQRFHPFYIEEQYRHVFYESPMLNAKDEDLCKAKMLHVRMHTMIYNFNVNPPVYSPNPIRVTPSFSEQKPLGERAIPYYYNSNANAYTDSHGNVLKVNYYWNYRKHIMKEENHIQSYNASFYSSPPLEVTSPLAYNILPNDFFRIEGHIGMEPIAAEAAINALITTNQLPFNVISIQIGSGTIIPKNWKLCCVQAPEFLIRQNILSILHACVDFCNTLTYGGYTGNYIKYIQSSKRQKALDDVTALLGMLNPLITTLAAPVLPVNFNTFETNYITAIAKAAVVLGEITDLGFSNTDTPLGLFIVDRSFHLLLQAESLIQGEIAEKYAEYLFPKFYSDNPGLEHSGGVLRGGTFVLVYTSNGTRKVVADFMVPYRVEDADTVTSPFEYTAVSDSNDSWPLSTLFVSVPAYQVLIDASNDRLTALEGFKTSYVDSERNMYRYVLRSMTGNCPPDLDWPPPERTEG